MSLEALNSLQNQIEQKDAVIKNVSAEREANKQLCNELLNSVIQLRASLILFQQAHQDNIQKAEDLNKSIDTKNARIAELHAEIEKLNNPAVNDATLSEPDAA